MEMLLVVIVVFFAVVIQSLVGFGAALVGMPLLVEILGIQTAAPLVALLGVTAEAFLVFYFRQDLRLRVVWQLVAAAAIGIPLGVLALVQVNEAIVLTVLGLVVVTYALYGLLSLRLPALSHPLWAWAMGFLAGVLGGAYNISGPPVIIYGHCRKWPSSEFKGNLQGFFVAVSLFVVVGHLLGRNFTSSVWQSYFVSLLPAALGILVGLRLGRRVDQVLFSRLVLLLLLVLGGRLLVGALVGG